MPEKQLVEARRPLEVVALPIRARREGQPTARHALKHGAALRRRGAQQASPFRQPTLNIMSGTPVFAGTRVPFQTLIDYLKPGAPLSEFFEDFPTVLKEQAVAALEELRRAE